MVFEWMEGETAQQGVMGLSSEMRRAACIEGGGKMPPRRVFPGCGGVGGLRGRKLRIGLG